MSVFSGPNAFTQDLVLHFDTANKKCYNGSGNIIYDLSGYNNNGTINGSPILDTINRGALYFDGIDDFINVNEPSIGFSPNKWTLCIWLRPGNQSSRFITPNSNGIDQFLQYNPTNQRIELNIVESADTNGRARNTANNSIMLDQWVYYCVSINNLDINIYLNGILTNTFTETISIGNWSGVWRIGQRGNSTFWYLGHISIIKLYNRILSASEIKQDFKSVKSRFGL